MKDYLRILIIFLLTFAFVNVNSQQRPKSGEWNGQNSGQSNLVEIKGKVVDEISEQPMPYATISIFSKKDSSLVNGGLTDENGDFSLMTKPGHYYGIIEFLGYEKVEIGEIILEKGKSKIDLGLIKKTPDAYTLSNVEIRAEKSEMQFALDKKVFNVGKDLANKGGSAEDILDNVPSVSVDIDGNVSLRGSENVRMLIDGRPSGLIGVENANGLRQLPANMIEKVEIITNPGARYEAEGMAGIINIVLKKDRKSGFNSSIDLSIGHPRELGINYTGNYRVGAANFFASYGLGDRRRPGGGFRNQVITTEDSIFYSDQIRDMDRGGLSHTLRGGIDFSIDKKQTLTGSITYRNSDEDNTTLLTYNDYLSTNNGVSRDLSLITERLDIEGEKESRLSYNIDYRNRMNDKGKELTASIQVRNDEETESSDFTETFFLSPNVPADFDEVIQRSGNIEGQSNILFQLDYVNPITKDSKFEIGARANFRGIDNDYLVEEKVDGNWQNIAGLSNDFNYDEDVIAGYFIYGSKIKRFSFQLGIRSEYSHVVTELETTNELNDRDYINFFPSVFLNYEINEGNALQVSYSQRVRRPRFWSLNPFFTFSDSRNFYSGNPNLDPAFTDYEVSHIKYWDKATLSSSIFWRHSTDVIQRVRTINEDGSTVTKPFNLNERDDYGLDVNLSYSGLKWWRIDGNFSAFGSITNGENIEQDFNSDSYTFRSRMTNRFTFWNKTDLQLRLNYRGPRETPQGSNDASYSIDLGLSKDFLNNKLTATISGRDLLNSRKRKYEIEEDNYFENGEFQWRSRSIRLTLSYRINQEKKRNRRNGQNGMNGEEFEGGEF